MWRWLKGEPASSAFAGYPSFAIEQIAPNNPLTNNIFAGITAMSTNKTWYGGDIVSSYMEENRIICSTMKAPMRSPFGSVRSHVMGKTVSKGFLRRRLIT